MNDLGGSVAGEGASQDADLTVKLIEQRGGEAIANYGDVSDETQSGEMIQQAVDTWGQLDVLVNNAGIVRDSVIWNMTVDDFDAVMRVHVRGTWLPCHHAANALARARRRTARRSPAASSTRSRARASSATSARRTTPRPRPRSPA